MNRHPARLCAAVAASVLLVGCSTTTAGSPTAADGAGEKAPSTATSTASTAAPTSGAAPTGGAVVGTATMRIEGGTNATIRYRINGGPEQVLNAQPLPWEHTFEARREVSSVVTADGGDTPLSCTIMYGTLLVSFKVEPRPSCNFYYVE